MRSQVLAFVRPVQKHSDWTRDELAELYRIEHALIQARLVVEVDRGVTDEGEPWFVFCRSDGEVLVHVSRIDGEYQLNSPGLTQPLRGKSFQAMTKSFVNQIPVRVSLDKMQGGAQLFVHPAAMLTVVIGTIFVAWDDVRSLSDFSKSEAAGQDGEERAAGLKAAFQAAFHSYIESLFGSGRDTQHNTQHSSFLTLMGTVAALAIGAAVIPEQDFHVFSSVDDAAVVAAVHSADADQTPAVDFLPESFALNATAAHGRAEQSAVIDEQQAQQYGTEQFVANPSVRLSHNDSSTADVPERATNLANADTLASDEQVRGEDHSQSSAMAGISTVRAASVAVESVYEAVKPAGGSAVSVQAELAAPNSAINQFFHAVRMDAQTFTVTAVDQSTISSLTALDHVGSAPVSVQTATLATTGGSFDIGSSQEFRLFDSTAAQIINDFLAANRDTAELITGSQFVIFYDGHRELDGVAPLHYETWETSAGTMIAIVGHSNTPFHQELLT